MSALSLRGILENNKLAGANYDDWYRNLRIILMHERLIDIINKPVVTTPVPKEDGSIDNERQHQDMDPPTIVEYLKKMYDAQSKTARYQLSKTLFKSTLDVDSPVGPHVLKMIDLIEQLEKLG
ncbi:uncharacterized protein [Arachis hypogaea]|uniref:uncharacterized protein n=1 Tax=Arachis hypogaea TaxID=3818 RepID=UPI003B21A219